MSDLQIFPTLGNYCGGSVQMLKISTYPKPVTRIHVFGAAGTFMPRHMEDNECHLTPLSRTSVIQAPSQPSHRRSYHPKNQCHDYISPALFIIHNITPLSGTHSGRILPLSTTALIQKSFFGTSCETVVSLGPRGTAVIELHSNQRRNLIDFPTHSTLMVSS